MKKTIIKPKSIISSFEKSKYFRPQAITLLEYLKDFAEYLETLDVTALNTKIETETTNRENAVNEEINARELADSELQHDIDSHTSNSVIHVTQADKNRWNTPTQIPSLSLSGASGTLSDEQITLVQADNLNFIMVDNEKYYKMDNKISSGYLGYAHIEKENSYTKVKILTITISTKGWVITEKSINDISITDVSATDNTAKEIVLNGGTHKIEHTEEEVLWTNSSPSSAFVGQNIPLSKNVDNFDYLVIFSYNNTTELYIISEEIKIIGSNNHYILNETHQIGGVTSFDDVHRYGNISNQTWDITNCYHNVGGTITEDNTYLIPYKVIGYKFTPSATNKKVK